MDDEDRGPRLSKRFSDKNADGEVDYKTKAGTAWSHSYLNQKPWHPLSYPNQRRKWIAEQTHAQQERRAEEVSREYAQEQEFFRQAALVSKKEKEKMEMMRAVSFMYVRPPGYNPESAKAAEIAEEKKALEPSEGPHSEEPGAAHMLQNPMPPIEEKKKPRPKDVFGRVLPTEEQFEALKNAPKLETGVAGRAKPFGIEIRNVKCVRCGAYGHQSGDRECPLKDAIMPNEESRLKRDDPLTAIIAQTESSEVDKDFAKFKEADLSIYETHYAPLFRDSVAVGDQTMTPLQFQNNSNPNDAQSQENMEGKGDSDEINLDDDEPLFSSFPASSSSKRKNGKGVANSRSTKSKTSAYMEKLDVIMDAISTKSTQTYPPNNPSPALADCMNIVNKFPGFNEGSKEYSKALLVFTKKQNREAFMFPTTDEAKMEFLKLLMEQ